MSLRTDPLDALDELEQEYSPTEPRPLRSYALLALAHVGVAGGAFALAARRNRLPKRIGLADLALGAVASYKLSRLMTRSPVTSPLRAPFTSYEGVAGPAELKEEVRGSGLRHAVGELVTCPYCMAHWAATAFGIGLVHQPRLTRTLASVLCVSAGADVLQRLDEKTSP